MEIADGPKKTRSHVAATAREGKASMDRGAIVHGVQCLLPATTTEGRHHFQPVSTLCPDVLTLCPEYDTASTRYFEHGFFFFKLPELGRVLRHPRGNAAFADGVPTTLRRVCEWLRCARLATPKRAMPPQVCLPTSTDPMFHVQPKGRG
jgi:hypothetical protein